MRGYWPIDLEQYESCFGTKQDLIDLVTAAHASGMQVLFDFAMVHRPRLGRVRQPRDLATTAGTELRGPGPTSPPGALGEALDHDCVDNRGKLVDDIWR